MKTIDEHGFRQDMASVLAETESRWLAVCNAVDDDRAEMLIDALIEQYSLVMEGESNANAMMALIGFVANRIVAFHKQSDVSLQSSMVLVQMGMQRAVNASITVNTKKRSDA